MKTQLYAPILLYSIAIMLSAGFAFAQESGSVPVITADVTSPTNSASILYTVEFGGTVSGFDAGDIAITADGIPVDAQRPVMLNEATYTFEVIHGIDEGAVTVLIRGGTTIVDGIASAESELHEITIDRIAPTVVDLSLLDDRTVILEMSEPVSEKFFNADQFEIPDLILSPRVDSIDIVGSTITLHLTQPITDEDSPRLFYTMRRGDIVDQAGNELANFRNRVIPNTIDNTGPDTTLTSTSSSPTNAEKISYKVVFGEPVTGFVINDIRVSGTANSNSPVISNFNGTGDTYTFDVRRGSSDGSVLVFIPVNIAKDAAGNNNIASNRIIITFDTAAPKPRLATTSDSPTNDKVLPFTVEFDKQVTGFNATDIIISGSADGTVGNFVAIDGDSYRFDVIRGSFDGRMEVSIPENAARDALGNYNAPSNIITRVIDTVPPMPVLSSKVLFDTNREIIQVTLDFGESVDKPILSQINITADGGGRLSGIFGTADDDAYTFNILRNTHDGDVSVYIPAGVTHDAAGNPNMRSNTLSFRIDTIPPVPTVTSDAAPLTNLLSVPYTVTFDTPVKDFDVDDILVSGRVNDLRPEASNFEGSNATYTFEVQSGATDGIIRVSVPEARATDLAGNPNEGSNELELLVDTRQPIVTNPRVLDGATIRLNTTEPVSESGDSGPNFVITGVASNPSVSLVTILDGTTSLPNVPASTIHISTIDLHLDSHITHEDSPEIAYFATDGSINDEATNPIGDFAARSVVNGLSVTELVPILSSEEPAVTNSDRILYKVIFDESVNDLEISNIIVSGTANSGSPVASNLNGTGDTYTFEVRRGSSDGTVAVYITQYAASTDNGGYQNIDPSLTLEHRFDTVPPVVDSAFVLDTDTINLDISEPVSDNGAVASDFAVTGIASAPQVVSIAVSDSILSLNLDRSITNTDEPQVSYFRTAGEIRDVATNRLADFADQAATNGIESSISAAVDLGPVTTLTPSTSPLHTNSSVSYTVVFSSNVTGFDDTDINVTGTANNGNPEVSAFVRENDTNYAFVVERGDSDGNVTVQIPKGAAQDASNNDNQASRLHEIIFDTAPPTVTITSDVGPLTNLEHILYEVEFNEAVFGIDTDAIMVDGSTNNTASFTGSGDTYTFNVTHGISAGPITVSVRAGAAQDAAGNNNVASGSPAIMIDRIAPVANNISVSGPNTIRLVMSEPVSEAGDTVGNFAISGVASGGDSDSLSVSGNTIDITIDGEILTTDSPRLEYTQSTANIVDAASNRLANFERAITNERDTTGPTPTISNGGITLTKLESIPFTVTFDEPVMDFIANSIDVIGPASVNGASFVQVNSTHYTFDVVRESDGQINVFIFSGAVHDKIGNDSITSNAVIFTFDTTPPTVTGGTVPNSETIILDLSEPILNNGTAASDFTVSGVGANIAVSDILFGTDTITLNLNNSITDTDAPQVSYTESTGTIHDPATNRLADFADSPIFNGIDGTRPIPTLVVGQITPEGASFIVTFDEPSLALTVRASP